MFDAASPFGVKVANKKVIEAGGMDKTTFLNGELKQQDTFRHGINELHL